jgi:hypothetical protein
MRKKCRRRRAQTVLIAAAVFVGGSVAASPAGAAGNGGPPPQAVLNVNDPNPIGPAGDSVLSLDEAVRLSNGTLALGTLSAAERAQIQGTPGGSSRDRIEMTAGSTLTVPLGQAVSPLVGNEGDTLDGNGALLKASASIQGVGLVIQSSDFTLTDIQVRDFEWPVRVDFGGRDLRNVTLEKLQLASRTFNGQSLQVAARSSNGSLRGISITDSTLDGLGSGNIVFIGSGVGTVEGHADVENTLLQDVVFARNTVKNGAHGIYLHGSLTGQNVNNATTRNVTLSDNTFTGIGAPVNIAGGLPAIGATNTNVTLENVLITRNNIQAGSWGIWMGHETFGFGQGTSTTRDNHMRHITVTENTITKSLPGLGQCIALETAPEFPGEVATNNTIEHVTFAKNHISGCKNPQGLGAGLAVNSGRASLLGLDGIATDNVMSDIKIMNNDITDSNRGVVAGGGSAPRRGVATGNIFEGLLIVGNTLTNNTTGIRIVGGDAVAGSNVTGNSVTRVTIQANTITGSTTPCEAIADAGVAFGNTVEATCPA